MKSRRPNTTWPPLVRPRNLSGSLRARDSLITLFAWGLMAWLIRHELHVLIDYFRPPVFRLTRVAVPNWAKFWNQFGGFVILSLVLVSWIALWGIWRRRFVYRLPAAVEPPALSLDAHSGYWLLARERLAAAQKAKTVRAEFNEVGRLIAFAAEKS
jgi:hypothetical protein